MSVVSQEPGGTWGRKSLTISEQFGLFTVRDHLGNEGMGRSVEKAITAYLDTTGHEIHNLTEGKYVANFFERAMKKVHP